MGNRANRQFTEAGLSETTSPPRLEPRLVRESRLIGSDAQADDRLIQPNEVSTGMLRSSKLLWLPPTIIRLYFFFRRMKSELHPLHRYQCNRNLFRTTFSFG